MINIDSDDLSDALEHASMSFDVDLNPNEFEFEYHPNFLIDDLYQYEDIDSWSQWYPGELLGLDEEDLKQELYDFRPMVHQWVEDKEISQPIIVIDSKHGTIIGDGRGRISLSIGMGWQTIPVIIAKEKEYDKSDNLIVIDVQPEYEKNIGFDLYEFCDYLNEIYGNKSILILYNGIGTCGETSEDELKLWYIEHGFEHAYEVDYYDKGYGFFRNCMDNSSVDESDLVNLVKFMSDREIMDSRQLAEEDWDDFIGMYEDKSVESIREILELSEDAIYIPDLMDWLSTWLRTNPGKIELCGGALSQCLAEVEIALNACNFKYKVNKDWIYD